MFNGPIGPLILNVFDGIWGSNPFVPHSRVHLDVSKGQVKMLSLALQILGLSILWFFAMTPLPQKPQKIERKCLFIIFFLFVFQFRYLEQHYTCQ